MFNCYLCNYKVNEYMFKFYIRCYFLVVIGVHLNDIYRHRGLLYIFYFLYLGHKFSK